ncbi:hypothetical protein SFRURICE_010582 [Spodoptera frugiperda]|nr:hypothetical protein SFRURICE_010582 [Spodoptera frugiperda]
MRAAEVVRRDKEPPPLVKSVKKRFIFFGRSSGVHGLHYLFDADRSLLSRAFWLMVLIACFFCLYLMMEDTGDLRVKVNFTPDTLYLNWTTTFPGVTVCEEYSTKLALRKFTKLYPDLLSPLDYDFRWYLTDTLFGRGQCSHATCILCGSSVACDVPWRTIIERVHKSCQEMVSECRYNDVEFPCCEYFREVDSEHGPCFSFNTLQHKGENSLFDLNRTTGPGVLMFRLLSDAEISIHSPEELSTQFLDGKLKEIVHTFIENHVSFLFSVVEIVNGEQLKTEPIEVRQCRYLHEVPDDLLHTYPVYSYGACRLAETTKEFYQQCGCVHPVRDLTYQELYCNYSGITCWNVYEGLKEKLGAEKIIKDNCLPSCVERDGRKMKIV